MFSKQKMIEKSYPNPGHEFYLVYNIDEKTEKEFEAMVFDITLLKEFSGARKSALPFSVSLTELMKVIVK